MAEGSTATSVAYGSPAAEAAVLEALGELGGRAGLDDVSDEALLSEATTRKALADLYDQGLVALDKGVEGEPDAWALTDEGRAALRSNEPASPSAPGCETATDPQPDGDAPADEALPEPAVEGETSPIGEAEGEASLYDRIVSELRTAYVAAMNGEGDDLVDPGDLAERLGVSTGAIYLALDEAYNDEAPDPLFHYSVCEADDDRLGWVRTCRVCGCTEDHGCLEGCEWVEGELDLCSACVDPSTMQLPARQVDEGELVDGDEGPALPEPLSDEEAADRERLEQVVDEGIQAGFRAGAALREIRDRKLYRAEFGTFEAYLTERWGISDAHGYRWINAAQVQENLKSIGAVIERESHARELEQLPASMQVAVYQRAAETVNGGRMTAKQLAAARDEVHRDAIVALLEKAGKPLTAQDFRKLPGLSDCYRLEDDHLAPLAKQKRIHKVGQSYPQFWALGAKTTEPLTITFDAGLVERIEMVMETYQSAERWVLDTIRDALIAAEKKGASDA